MEKKEVINYINQKVKLVLKDQYIYSGIILTVSDSSVRIKDKFGSELSISLDQIGVIKTLKEEESNV